MSKSLYKVLAVATMLLSVQAGFAQAAADGVPFIEKHSETIMLSLIGVTLFIAMAVIFVLADLLMSSVQDMRKDILAEKGLLLEEEPEDVLSRWWNKFWRQANDLKPIEQEEEIALDHDYDGIRELDNNLPPWWKALFYGSIAWAVVYMFYFHVTGQGDLQAEEFAQEMKQAEIQIAEYLKKEANNVDESSVTLLTDASDLAKGKSIYDVNCVACHGMFGEGGVGTNFADEYWIHGGGIKNVFKTIKYGVPAKGMISWQTQLKPVEMQQVASYLLTFQGTTPENAKEPQGELWIDEGAPAEEEAAEPADSTTITEEAEAAIELEPDPDKENI